MIKKKIEYGLLCHASALFLQLATDSFDAQVRIFDGLHEDRDDLGIGRPLDIAHHGAPTTDLSPVNCRLGGEVNEASVMYFSFQSCMMPEEREK